jgi:hypothetical protein
MQTTTRGPNRPISPSISAGVVVATSVRGRRVRMPAAMTSW